MGNIWSQVKSLPHGVVAKIGGMRVYRRAGNKFTSEILAIESIPDGVTLYRIASSVYKQGGMSPIHRTTLEYFQQLIAQ